METLKPAQRVVVILVGLAATLLLVIPLLPWLSRHFEERMIPTSTPLPTPTRPAPTPTLTATPNISATLKLTPPPTTVLDMVPHISQTVQYNGSAALAMVLGYWGYTDTHELVAAAVQPGEIDASVELEELAAYAQSRGLGAFIGVNGDDVQLRRLVGNGFPVLLSEWVTATEGIGSRHYPVVYGYDRTAQSFALHDPVVGDAGTTQSYPQLAATWRAANRTYLLVWPEKEAERAEALLAMEQEQLWQGALAWAERELAQDDEDALAYLNQASALAALGRCPEALVASERAHELGLPDGLWWHRFAIYDCYLDQDAYEPLLALLQAAVEGGALLEQIPLYQARAYKALGNAEQAQMAYEQALAIHPGWEVVLQEQSTP